LRECVLAGAITTSNVRQLVRKPTPDGARRIACQRYKFDANGLGKLGSKAMVRKLSLFCTVAFALLFPIQSFAAHSGQFSNKIDWRRRGWEFEPTVRLPVQRRAAQSPDRYVVPFAC
jgi:hypothetical protein